MTSGVYRSVLQSGFRVFSARRRGPAPKGVGQRGFFLFTPSLREELDRRHDERSVQAWLT